MPEIIESCSFCDLLKDVKARSENYASYKPEIKEDYTSICKAALVVEDSWRGEFGGRVSYNPRTLNFCPSCGRKLEKEEIAW